MKIGIIAHLKHAIREPFAGGLEMHTYSLCKALRRRGHDVTLFAAAGSAGDLGLESICDEPVQTSLASAEQFRQEHRTYLALMEDLLHRKFDIIHNNSLHYIPLALADELPMPMVTVLHTPPFWEMEGSISQNRSRKDSYVAVSSFIRDHWTRITRVDQVIHNGIDLKNFRFVSRPSTPPYIVWSGRIVPEKGLHLAISASREAGLNLRIAGPIFDHAYYDNAIAPHLDQHSVYVGHVGHAELAELVGGASAFLFSPLWDEPYGLVLAEALACGTPVASFARGAVDEILDESCGIIVPSGDVAGLARAAHDVQRLSRFDCRKRAEDIADLGSMVTKYEGLYQRLIERMKPGRTGPSLLLRGFPEIPNAQALHDHYMAHGSGMMSKVPTSLRP